MYNVLQHYYDERCSPESLSPLLTLRVAKNNGGACALSDSIEKHKQSFQKMRNSVNV